LFKDVDPKVNFPQMEEQVLSYWQDRSIFQKSIDNREGAPDYVFYDGPPFATGLPHFGHFVPGTIKDIFPRYHTMKGKRVERRFGWDTHGLPVEYEMEKTLGISGKYEIEQYGVAKFNEECRSIVLRYTSEWESIVTRLGRWVDFDNDYKTMDPSFMESIWWVFKTLWEKKYVYQGYYILPVSPKLGTPLSNFEVNLGGYKDVTDPAITVKFRLNDNPDTSFLAWTTTPWTLPSNLALGLGGDIDYVKIQDGNSETGEKFILAAERLSHYYKSEEDYSVIEHYKGKDLAGISYEPLLPYFADAAKEGAFKTFLGDFVTTEDGTGIVHLAPGFGEDDYNTLKGTGIPTVCPIDDECKFTEEIPEYQGQFVKDADKAIIARLKEEGKLIRRENYLHPYPHCYRTGAPLIYKAVTSWFVDIGKIKGMMLGANAQINWTPDHLKNGRFGKWLEGARDWAISRNRFWGNPIPVWQCDKTGEMVCIGSIEELEKLSGVRPDDLHKHFVDEITWISPAGGTFRRVPEVLDCWFESGAMPYAQVHYPFENKDWFEKNFPANFISEGLDQTRGWFYTLTILAAALFDKPAFQNVVVNGLVLAEDGKKMSKSLRNYSDPMEVINEFGADALRLFMMMSSVVKAEDLKYSDTGVRDVLKGILIPLWNSYYFFITYAKLDGLRPTSAPDSPQNPLDAWIISEMETLIHRVTEELDSYDIQRAIAPILEFIDGLNNWYIRRSRRRFWKSENDGDKNEAYQTLYYVLKTLAKVMAPITPFIAEEFYQNLKNEDEPESVHLCDYPEAREERRDSALERKMELTQQAVSMGRRLRVMHNLKTRQPLKALHLVTKDPEERNILLEMQDIIVEELNVKEVVFRQNEEELVEYQAKANFKVLGRQLGKDMKAAAARIEKLSNEEIAGLLDGATLVIEVGERSIELTSESLDIRRFEKENLKILNEKSLTIALDPQLSPELIQEGIVRDLTRGIQNLRKERGLEVSDRISVYIYGGDLIKDSLDNFGDYLTGETLGEEIIFEKAQDAIEVEAGEEKAFVSFVKV
jgi:isoleucyl-tRNA synthetase